MNLSKTVTNEHKSAFDKAKIHLMSKPDAMFFISVCFSLRHVFSYDACTRMATDGSAIYMNPDYFMSIDKELRVSGLMHETLHCALMHFCRMGGRDKERWNIAADHVINLMLKERGFAIGDDWYCDEQYTGLSVEQVYDLLPEGISCNPNLVDIRESTGEEGQTVEAMRHILVRAAIQSKMSNDKPGSIPAAIEIYLQHLNNPKLPWPVILRRYFRSFDKNDYSFKKPNRRFFPEYFLPGMHSESLDDIAVAVDTSGSVSDDDFANFIAETKSIFKMARPKRIQFIQFDTEVKSVTTVKSIQELLKVEFTGRGGTCIEPVLEWAAANNPQLLLVFSDGEFYFSDDRGIKCPVLWVVHDNPYFSPPFGKTIHHTLNGHA
jgi:predicted metal-dependent peptidase